MSKISVDEVKQLAKLSNISITDDQATQYAKELESVLSYVESLSSVDTKGVKPTSQVTGLTNVNRDDVEQDYQVTPEELIEGTEDTQDRYIKVKKVL